MLSNPQKATIKRAQREAEIEDAEYRELLEMVTGCTSSTDPRIGERDFDKILAFFEAIFWRKVEQGALQPSCKANAVFRQKGYWASKNTRQETSRDRFTLDRLAVSIAAWEDKLAELGYEPAYWAGIRRRVTGGRSDLRALFNYRAALSRTVEAKRRKEEVPF
jgi:hypothetical protein